MTSRERFEEEMRRDGPVFLSKRPLNLELIWRSSLSSYQDQDEERAWRLWQAAYAAGQEAMRRRAMDAYVLLPPRGTQVHADFVAGVAAKTAAISTLEIEK